MLKISFIWNIWIQSYQMLHKKHLFQLDEHVCVFSLIKEIIIINAAVWLNERLGYVNKKQTSIDSKLDFSKENYKQSYSDNFL